MTFEPPLFYRIWNMYVEPLLALGGLIQAASDPDTFLSQFCPTPISLITYSLKGDLTPLDQLLLTQTLSLYSLFFIIKFILLRWALHSDGLTPFAQYRLWYIAFCGALVSDIFYLGASYRLFMVTHQTSLFWNVFQWQKNWPSQRRSLPLSSV